jgi:hypothetical protein
LEGSDGEDIGVKNGAYFVRVAFRDVPQKY